MSVSFRCLILPRIDALIKRSLYSLDEIQSARVTCFCVFCLATKLRHRLGPSFSEKTLLPDPAPLNRFFRDLILASGRQIDTAQESEGQSR